MFIFYKPVRKSEVPRSRARARACVCGWVGGRLVTLPLIEGIVIQLQLWLHDVTKGMQPA
jgi:hypothetical protein